MYFNRSQAPAQLDYLIAFGLSVLALVSYIPFLGQVFLLDWDELIYASAAREMLESGNFLQVYVNYFPFWEKPPLYFWLQALSFKLFGVSEWAARLPSSVFMALTVGLVFLIGTYLRDRWFGLLWAGLFATGLLPVFYGKYGIIDPVFNFFVIGTLFSLFLWDKSRLERNSWLPWFWASCAALSVALAVTAKGPLALVLAFGIFTVYKIWNLKPWIRPFGLALFLLGSAVLASGWFALETLTHGPWFIQSFIKYQLRIASGDDGHPGPFFYHFLIFSLGCFPFAVFTPVGILQRVEDNSLRFKRLAIIWFGLVFLLFSFVVQTKLPHYSSLLYVPGSFFAALRLDHLISKRKRPHPLEFAGLILTMALYVLVVGLVVYVGENPSFRELLIDRFVPALRADPLAMAYIALPVDWPTWTYLPAVLILLGTVIGCILLWSKNIRWGIATLGITSLVTMTGLWTIQIQRFGIYTQGNEISLFRQGKDHIYPLAFYGPRSYVGPFYARTQVLNPANNKELAQVLQKDKQLTLVVRRIDLATIEELVTVRLLKEESPFLLVEATAHTAPVLIPFLPSKALVPPPLAPPASSSPPMS